LKREGWEETTRSPLGNKFVVCLFSWPNNQRCRGSPLSQASKELADKLVQLTKDRELLRKGTYQRLDIVTPEKLPTNRRGAEFTKMVETLKKEFPGRVQDHVLPFKLCP
jgi:hypothetical protein